MRFLRGRGGPKASGKGLEFDIAVPEGLDAHRGFAGYDLTIATGEPADPRATTISVGALRDTAAPVTLDEHVARVAANLAGAELSRRVVDDGATEIAGYAAWWTFESAVADGPAFVVERWLLVRDGVGWTVNVQIPWMSLHQVRNGALAVVGSLRFRDADAGDPS
jgi:hypothetical protein